MKTPSSLLRRSVGLLLLGAGLSLGLTACHDDYRRPVHHGDYDHRRDHRDDRYHDGGDRYRGTDRRSTVYYDQPVVTVRRDRAYSY